MSELFQLKKLDQTARWLLLSAEWFHVSGHTYLRAGKRLLFNSQAVEDVLLMCTAGNEVEDMTDE